MSCHGLPDLREDFLVILHIVLVILHISVRRSDQRWPHGITGGHRGNIISVDDALNACSWRVSGALTNGFVVKSMDLSSDLSGTPKIQTGAFTRGVVFTLTPTNLPVTILIASQNSGLVGVLVSVLDSWRTKNRLRGYLLAVKRWGRASMRMFGSSQGPGLMSPVHRVEKEGSFDRTAEMFPLLGDYKSHLLFQS